MRPASSRSRVDEPLAVAGPVLAAAQRSIVSCTPARRCRARSEVREVEVAARYDPPEQRRRGRHTVGTSSTPASPQLLRRIRSALLAQRDAGDREHRSESRSAGAEVDTVRTEAAARLLEQPARLVRVVAETAPSRLIVAAGGGKDDAVASPRRGCRIPGKSARMRAVSVDGMRDRPPHAACCREPGDPEGGCETQDAPTPVPVLNARVTPSQLPQRPNLAGRDREAVGEVELAPPQPLDRLSPLGISQNRNTILVEIGGPRHPSNAGCGRT